MSMTVEELTSRLNAEAQREALSPVRVLEQLSAQLPPVAEGIENAVPISRRHLAFAAVGSSDSNIRAHDLDDALAEGFGRA